MKPSQKSAPALQAPHNSGERVQNGDTALAGADTPSSVSTPAKDATALALEAAINFIGQTSEYKRGDTGASSIVNRLGVALRATPQTPDAVDRPHITMTPEEYAAMPLQGWHQVYRDVDGFGGVGIRYMGVSTPSASASWSSKATLIPRAEADWKDDPSSDERWNAGLDFAMQQLCKALDVDPEKVTWDAATETVAGDVQAVMWNIIRTRFGEDFDPDAHPQPQQADGRQQDETTVLPAETIAYWFMDNHPGLDLLHADITDLIDRARIDGARQQAEGRGTVAGCAQDGKGAAS